MNTPNLGQPVPQSKMRYGQFCLHHPGDAINSQW